jgi:hypothetical protein
MTKPNAKPPTKRLVPIENQEAIRNQMRIAKTAIRPPSKDYPADHIVIDAQIAVAIHRSPDDAATLAKLYKTTARTIELIKGLWR